MVNKEFLGFSCVKQEVIVCAPNDILNHFNAVLGFNIVGAQERLRHLHILIVFTEPWMVHGKKSKEERSQLRVRV